MLPTIGIHEAEKIINRQVLVSSRGATFGVGDSVIVETVYQIDKKKNQYNEGIVISRKGSGINTTFTVRRTTLGFGVELVFQLFSPLVVSVRVRKTGLVRRAKLYYLRCISPKLKG